VCHACHWLRPIELKDKGEVLVERLLSNRLISLIAEGHALPVLALILAEVEHLEGLAVLDAEQPLAGNVDTPTAQVAANPATAQLLGDGECGARAAEEVGDEASLARRLSGFCVGKPRRSADVGLMRFTSSQRSVTGVPFASLRKRFLLKDFPVDDRTISPLLCRSFIVSSEYRQKPFTPRNS
jgi:hypothetical protein